MINDIFSAWTAIVLPNYVMFLFALTAADAIFFTLLDSFL